MSAIVLRRAIRLTGKNLPRFSPELRGADADPLDTFPGEGLIPQFAHPAGLTHREIEASFAPLRK
jgi:hypothetical protein